MAILSIRHLPDPILRTVMKPVQTVTPEIRQLARDMIETMHAAGGVGLAANQVGQPWRLFVAIADSPASSQEIVLLNPRILSRHGRVQTDEGCLSLPGISSTVPRASNVRIQGMTLEGRSTILEAQGLLARIFQHETDHLRGHLFIDRLSWLARRRLLKQYHRQQRELARIQLP